MNDDISLALTIMRDGFNGWSPSFPKLIFYPSIAQASTYKALARAFPQMRLTIARAAIFADYQDLFDWIVKGPNSEFETITLQRSLWVEALQSPHDYYRDVIEALAKERGIFNELGNFTPDVPAYEQHSIREATFHTTARALKPNDWIWGNINCYQEDWPCCIYDGIVCEVSRLERLLSLPREWQPTEQEVDPGLHHRILDYETWPPNIEELLKPSDAE